MSLTLIILFSQTAYGADASKVLEQATYNASANVEASKKKKNKTTASPYDKVKIKKKPAEYNRKNPKCGNCPSSVKPE